MGRAGSPRALHASLGSHIPCLRHANAAAKPSSPSPGPPSRVSPAVTRNTAARGIGGGGPSGQPHTPACRPETPENDKAAPGLVAGQEWRIEGQTGGNCLVHALNNALGKRVVSAQNLMQYCNEKHPILDPQIDYGYHADGWFDLRAVGELSMRFTVRPILCKPQCWQRICATLPVFCTTYSMEKLLEQSFYRLRATWLELFVGGTAAVECVG